MWGACALGASASWHGRAVPSGGASPRGSGHQTFKSAIVAEVQRTRSQAPPPRCPPSFAQYPMAHAAPPPSWADVAAAGRAWAAPREPRAGDVPLVFYRDSNSWCPYCTRVWFALEQKGLRYRTERVPMGRDPREPKKPQWYRDLVPTGNVPAMRIGDDLIWESLDILFRLEHVFAERVPLLPAPGPERDATVAAMTALEAAVGRVDRAVVAWLGNTNTDRERSLEHAALRELARLDDTVGARDGPFLLGAAPSLADAACVGKMQQLALRLPFFKGCGALRDPAGPCPRLAAWFAALEGTPGFAAVKQDPGFEQRVYQGHPDRRADAPRFLRLGPPGSLVGEPAEYAAAVPPAPVAALAAGTAPALEAAWRLAQQREPLAAFLLRKEREALGVGWRAAREPTTGAGRARLQRELDAVDEQLRAVAAVLTGLADVAAAASGGAWRAGGPVAQMGALVGTPRDMSVAAAAQLRGALAALRDSAGPPGGRGSPGRGAEETGTALGRGGRPDPKRRSGRCRHLHSAAPAAGRGPGGGWERGAVVKGAGGPRPPTS